MLILEFNYEPNYTRDSVKDWYLEDKCDGNLLEYQILQDHNGPHETGVTETQDEDDVFCETEAHNNKRLVMHKSGQHAHKSFLTPDSFIHKNKRMSLTLK